MKKHATAVAMSVILALLAGCASPHRPPPPRYAVPEGAPTADLKSGIWGANDRHESIDVYVSEGSCRGAKSARLFSIQRSKSDPDGYVKIAADRPLTLEYIEAASGGRSCHISLDVNLAPGKSYSLVGGFDYKSGPIPILTGTRMCRFAVQDDADKTLVSRKSACSK